MLRHNMASYEPANVPSLDKLRRMTNKKSLIVFSVFMIAYIAVAAYAFSNSNIKESKENEKLFNKVLNKIAEMKWLVVGFIGFSMLTTVVCSFLVRAISKYLIIVSLVLECIGFASFIMSFIGVFFAFKATTFFTYLIITCLYAWSLYVKIYVLKNVGTKLMSEVIKEASRAAMQFPWALGFVVLITVLVFIVLIFGLAASVHLSSINLNNFLFKLFSFLIVYGTTWLVLAISAFGYMVLFGIYGSWFWTMDKSIIPNDITLKAFAIVFRYHLGTAAYGSSILVIVPVILAMIRGLSNRTYCSRHNIFVLIVCWWNIFWKLYDSAIGLTAIDGKSFKKSADIVCQRYLRFPIRLYAITKAYEWCGTFLASLCSIIMAIVFFAMFPIKNTTNASDETTTTTIVAILTLCFCLLVIVVPILMIFEVAITSIFYCILEDYEKDQEDRQRRGFMKPLIKELMIDSE